LAGDNPEVGYRAAWLLAAAPDKALGMLKTRLTPLTAPDLARVPRLLADLDDNDFQVREAAYKQLQALGPLVEETLRKTLAGMPSPEVRKSVERIKGTVAITVWDRVTGQLRGRFAGKGTALAFSPDGRYLATARGSDVHLGGNLLDAPGAVAVDGRLRLWEVESGQEVLKFPDGVLPTVVAFAPDGRTLAAGLKDGGVQVWNLAPAGEPVPPTDLGAADFEKAWSALVSDDAAEAYRGLWQLRAMGVKAVPFLAERLRPTLADNPALARFLADLDAEQFAVRDAAFRELERRGADAEPALCLALQRAPSPAVREKVLQLLGAPGIVRHADATGRERAVAALETIGTAEARALLAELAKGPPLVGQTQAARAALARLGSP
jgi:hypothetical protein